MATPIIGLSPMDGATDYPFRHIMATHGHPDVMFTEFTNVGDICHGRRMGWETLLYSKAERPIVAQLYGKDPLLFYQAAQVVCELGFDGLDINMGCPSKNVASSGSGAGLIRTPELALKIMEAAHQGIQDWAAGQSLAEGGVTPRAQNNLQLMNPESQAPGFQIFRKSIPLSVKTRLGYDSVIIDEWSDCLVQGNPEVISIHGRTLTQMYRGEADWEAIDQVAPRIKQKGILVLGNGDVQSLQDAGNRIQRHRVDGVLIGRAALGNPWIFRGINRFRQCLQGESGQPFEEFHVDLSTRFQVMLAHASFFEAHHGKKPFPRMRKHLGWYCSGFPYAAMMRAQMVKTSCSEDVAKFLSEYQATHPQESLSLLASSSV